MSKWIECNLVPAQKGRKTSIWCVTTKDHSALLGWIKWFAAWRKYCFFPEERTIFEEQCLRDIADFCESETKEYKVKA